MVEKHGGKDWKEWQDYQQLEAQWPVLCEVISWCIQQDRYNDVKLFWQYVKCYSYIQGYQGDRQTNWQNRLHWTKWLITTAKQYQDWSMVARCPK